MTAVALQSNFSEITQGKGAALMIFDWLEEG